MAPLFGYSLAARRVLYSSNAVESLDTQLRKVTKTPGHFPSDATPVGLLYLALQNVLATWQRPTAEWRAALPSLAVIFRLDP